MINRYTILLAALILFTIPETNAQKKIVLASVWGVPMFQSGFGIGQLGFEYQQKNEHHAWQFSLGMSGGAIASDVGTTHRKWITVDRIITFSKKKFSESPLFLTVFIEGGSRKRSPGHIHITGDSVINEFRAAEINPGIGIGKYVQIGKKIRMQLVAAPKAIFAFHRDNYYDAANKSYFTDLYNDLKIGYRLTANFCIRL